MLSAHRSDVTLESSGWQTILIAAVDQAGNRSVPAEIDINFNENLPMSDSTGWNCATSLPPLWWVLPLVLRRNRRRQRR
jgi:hypothetical protein